MIEKIGKPGYELLSTASCDVTAVLEMLLAEHPKQLHVAEIGIGIGATSLEIAKRLRKEDTFSFFSYEDEVTELYQDLKALGEVNCTLQPIGNTRAIYDSYNWGLGKLALENPKNGIFDLVYMDGAHAFTFDGLACVLVKQLMRPGGFLIFDDLNWAMGNSKEHEKGERPDYDAGYSSEQLSTAQVEMTVNIFMAHDREWVRFPSSPDWPRAVYRKKGKRISPRVYQHYIHNLAFNIDRRIGEKFLWKFKRDVKQTFLRAVHMAAKNASGSKGAGHGES